jgi:hypothetical protein
MARACYTKFSDCFNRNGLQLKGSILIHIASQLHNILISISIDVSIDIFEYYNTERNTK